MNNLTKKALIVGTPFFILIISILVTTLLNQNFSSPLDKEWVTRQFIIGLFLFSGAAIIPRLLHLQLFLSGGIPSFSVNLSHHPDKLRLDHEIQIRNYSICSGCLGSFLSILAAEIIFFTYFLNPSLFFRDFAVIYLLKGLFLILISYTRYFLNFKPLIRLIQHIPLFMGVVLAIIACDVEFQSAFSMMFLLPSWCLFLLIRVKLGELDHKEFHQ
ncbi:MAG: hypothetical protein ACFFB2_09595 [Promethearchaeota archaeon]